MIVDSTIEGNDCSDRTVFSSTKNHLIASKNRKLKEHLGAWQDIGDVFEAGRATILPWLVCG